MKFFLCVGAHDPLLLWTAVGHRMGESDKYPYLAAILWKLEDYGLPTTYKPSVHGPQHHCRTAAVRWFGPDGRQVLTSTT